MKYTFWDIVIVNWNEFWVIVKCWGKWNRWFRTYEVYVRIHNWVKEFKEDEIQRYMVRHKYLEWDEIEYQYNSQDESQ